MNDVIDDVMFSLILFNSEALFRMINSRFKTDTKIFIDWSFSETIKKLKKY